MNIVAPIGQMQLLCHQNCLGCLVQGHKSRFWLLLTWGKKAQNKIQISTKEGGKRTTFRRQMPQNRAFLRLFEHRPSARAKLGFPSASFGVRNPGKHKQQVAQAVEISHHRREDSLRGLA